MSCAAAWPPAAEPNVRKRRIRPYGPAVPVTTGAAGLVGAGRPPQVGAVSRSSRLPNDLLTQRRDVYVCDCKQLGRSPGERTMNSTLNTAFYLPFATRDSDRSRAETSLIQDLLCYDTVLVLTDHMSAVGMLAQLIGPSAMESALESGAIRFVNDRNILGWTTRTASAGISPIVPIRVLPTVDRPQAFTESNLRFLATVAAKGFGFDESTFSSIARLAEKTGIDFTEPIALDEAPGTDGKTGGLARGIVERVQTYKKVVPELRGFPLTLGDLLRFERDLLDNKRSPLSSKRLRVLKAGLDSGWHIADQVIPATRKQLGLLNLYLSDHFLAVHAVAAPESTLHT